MHQKIKIRKAKIEDMDSIAELKKKLSDFHRKIDDYFRPGIEVEKN